MMSVMDFIASKMDMQVEFLDFLFVLQVSLTLHLLFKFDAGGRIRRP